MSAMRYFLTLFIISIFPVSTFADSDIYLTQKSIQQFIASMPDVKEWNTENSRDIPNQFSDKDMRYIYEKSMSPFQAILNTSSDPDLHEELSDIIKRHGFSSVDDWAETGNRISNAYLAMNQAFNDRRAVRALNNTRKKIASNECGLPSHYQSALINIADTAKESIDAIQNVTPHEIKLVRHNVMEIQDVFNK